MESFREALREEAKANYFLQFRVESESRRVTSHYLLYATKHPLGFKIMKEVMWDAGRSNTDEGGLELLQASKGEGMLFKRADLADQEAAVLGELQGGRRQVRLFRMEWVYRPDDLFTDSSYRKCLLSLEEQGKIIVLDKDGRSPKPAAARPKRSGQATLGQDYWVQLVDKPKTS